MATADPALAISPNLPVTEWFAADPSNGGRGFKNLDVDVFVFRYPVPGPGQVAPAHFAINQISWQYGPVGGYIGFQAVPEGGRILFSVWDAIGVYCAGLSQLQECGPTQGAEAGGYTGQQAYSIRQGHTYQFQVRYAWEDATGVWWNGYVKDTDLTTSTPVSVTTRMASIKTPKAAGYLDGFVAAMIEYFGGARTTTCAQIAYARFRRGNPRFDGVPSATHQSHTDQVPGQCPAGTVEQNGWVNQMIGRP